MLGCDLDPTVPCRGFEGDCADLPAQFSDLPGALAWRRCFLHMMTKRSDPHRAFAPALFPSS